MLRRRDPVAWAWVTITILLAASVLNLVLSHDSAPAAGPRALAAAGADQPPANITLPPTTGSPRPSTSSSSSSAPVAPRAFRGPAAPTKPRYTATAFHGLGAWVDVFDWSTQYTHGAPPFGLAEVDRMAAEGTQTMFIQAARADAPDQAILEVGRVQALIARAHLRGMRVVVWYLPSFEDVNADLAHLLAIAQLPAEAIAVDIESTKVRDAAERSRRLVTLTQALRRALPGRPIAATVLPPVVTDVINTGYWPGFPWKAIASSYDAWQVMDYWTLRTRGSGYRDAYRYTAENLDRLKANLGGGEYVMDPIGGIGDQTTIADIAGFHRAATERGAVGGSVYDFRTTGASLWAGLRAFRR
ncbi:MAG: hypothetical protein QOG03_2642 [Actinomycetota bacterium]|jgi:hypothetical protein|nr:hypothetical protein [Actinomycetota bacterium]